MFYRRVRLFCELPLRSVESATGISVGRIAAIETGQREPNSAERKALESYLSARLRIAIEQDGPIPEWLRAPSAVVAGGES